MSACFINHDNRIMILPIFAYGQSVLKKIGADITPDYPQLAELIENMWETMYAASGVGLAAPQIGLSIRLFVVDTIQVLEKEKDSRETGIKQVFINAQILEEDGSFWSYEEGCLSIPNVRGEVDRQERIRIRYLDEHFVEKEAAFNGINARVIQHEYDHIDGILFTELLSPMKKSLIRRKLEFIKKGKVDVEYKMKFARI